MTIKRKINQYQTDLQKIYVSNGKIAKWATSIDNANGEVMGPLKVCANDSNKIMEYYESLSNEEKNKMHCFSLFSSCIDKIDYYPLYINDNEWKEIDTKEDLENVSDFFNN